MRRIARALVALAAVLAIAATVASSASAAAQHEININGRATLEVGQPTTVLVEGMVAPPAEYWDQTWILAVAIPASAISGCPEDASSAGAVGEQAGTILAIAAVPNAEESGKFVNVLGFTPSAPGPILICAYLYNEVGSTWGWAGILPEVVAAGGGSTGRPTGTPAGTGTTPGAGPVNLSRPWVTRSGRRLICHPGTWSNGDGTYAFNWLLDGRPTRISGRRPVGPGTAGRGHKVSCVVTAYGPGESSATATSPSLLLRR